MNLQILVIDDEPAIRRALTRVLERAGCSVRTAEDGAIGLQMLRAEAVDLVITDIIMPNVHGVSVIEAITREFPKVRVIAISGGGNFNSAECLPNAITTSAYLAAAKQAGAHAALTKPFLSSDVLQAIESATRGG
jgi:CheY-like chemotaxis protein